MKIYYDPATESAPIIIAGNPPADQSAEVTALQQQVAALEAKITAARVGAQAAKDADAATVDGQAVLNALA